MIDLNKFNQNIEVVNQLNIDLLSRKYLKEESLAQLYSYFVWKEKLVLIIEQSHPQSLSNFVYQERNNQLSRFEIQQIVNKLVHVVKVMQYHNLHPFLFTMERIKVSHKPISLEFSVQVNLPLNMFFRSEVKPKVNSIYFPDPEHLEELNMSWEGMLYSLGMVMYILINHIKETEYENIYNLWKTHKLHLNFMNLTVSELSFLKGLLENDPAKRIKMKDLLTHSYLYFSIKDHPLVHNLNNTLFLKNLTFEGTNLGTAGLNIMNEVVKHEGVNFKKIKLQATNLRKDAGIVLTQILSSTPNVTHIKINSNPNIENKGIKDLFDGIKKNPSLRIQTLNLTRMKLGEIASKSISDFIGSNKFLKTIILDSNNFDELSAEWIATGLVNSSRLEHLSLYDNQISANGANQISKAIIENLSNTLKFLDLSSCNLMTNGAKSIGSVLRSSSSLKHLRINHNLILDQGAIEIGKALLVNTSLTNLNLAFNKIGDSGIIGLSQALISNEGLMIINLNGNSINQKSAEVFSNAMIANHTIQEVYLNFCQIENDAFKFLCKWLDKSLTVEVVSLMGNEIDEEGILHLKSTISNNNVLRKLILSENNINKGAEAIFKLLQKNNSLTHLEINWCKIKNDSFKKIFEYLQQNSAIQYLSLNGNNVGKEAGVILQGLIQKSISLRHISADWCDIPHNIISDMFDLIPMGSPLKELHLHGNYFKKFETKTNPIIFT